MAEGPVGWPLGAGDWVTDALGAGALVAAGCAPQAATMRHRMDRLVMRDRASRRKVFMTGKTPGRGGDVARVSPS